MLKKQKSPSKNQLKLPLNFDKSNLQLTGQIDICQYRNSLVNLKKNADTFDDDTFRRFNTEQNPVQQNQNPFSEPRKQPQIKYKYRFYSQTDQKFVPEPWSDQINIFATQLKSPITQIRHKEPNMQRSLKISSSSLYRDKGFKSALFGNHSAKKQEQRQHQQKLRNSEIFSSFETTNEQKARISLDHFVQKKKNSKISKILKMKTHYFDQTTLKQQKLTTQSKSLIQALQKLSTDQILKKSIDRAVDVLKKRNNNSLYNKKVQKKPLQRSIIDETSINWFSCHKLQPKNESPSRVYDLNKTQSQSQSRNQQGFIEVNKVQKNLAIKQKYKISYKPKRNLMLDTKQQDQKKNEVIKPKLGSLQSSIQQKIKAETLSSRLLKMRYQ